MKKRLSINVAAKNSLKVLRYTQLKVCLIAILLTVSQVSVKSNPFRAASVCSEQGDTVSVNIQPNLDRLV